MTFSVLINGLSHSNITMVQNYSALERAFPLNNTQSIDVELSKLTTSTRVILNALEFYSVFDIELATYSKDSKCPLLVKQELIMLNLCYSRN